MTSSKTHPETLIVQGLAVKQGVISGDWIHNPLPEMGEDGLSVSEVLAAGKPVLVAIDGETYVVSQWPIPGVQTIADMKIDNKELSLLSGRIHTGHAATDYQPLVNRRVHYLVNHIGRILMPAESPLAKAA